MRLKAWMRWVPWLSFLMPLQSLAGDKPVVAIFDIQTKRITLEADVLDLLADQLVTGLSASGKFQVVPRSQLKERLSQQKTDSYKACYDQQCQIELGREVAAAKSLATQIGKIADQCTITANLFDLKKATTDAAAQETGGCDERSLFSMLRTVLAKINHPEAPVAGDGQQQSVAKTAPPVGEELLNGSFQAGPGPFPAQFKGWAMSCAHAPGRYDCSSNMDPSKAQFDGTPVFLSVKENYEIEYTMYFLRSDTRTSVAMGIGQGPNNRGIYLNISIDGEPHIFVNYSDGSNWSYIIHDRANPDITRDGEIRARVLVKGSRVSFFIKDKRVAVFDAPISVSGGIRMVLGGPGGFSLRSLIVRDAP